MLDNLKEEIFVLKKCNNYNANNEEKFKLTLNKRYTLKKATDKQKSKRHTGQRYFISPKNRTNLEKKLGLENMRIFIFIT